MIDDIPEKAVKDVLEILGLQEGLRITTVKKGHKKYMEHKKKLQVASDKPGPSKGKAGGKGPKYMPKGRVAEEILTEFREASGELPDDRYKRMYKHGPVIDPTGNGNHADYNTFTHNHAQHEGKFAKYNTLKNGKKTPAMWIVSHIHEKPNPKTGNRHRVLHMMTPDEHMARAAFHKLDGNADGVLLHPPRTLKHKPHEVSKVEPLAEGFLSRKMKSIKKYVTGSGAAQQERLAAKLKDQIAAQPAKIAAQDDFGAQIDAKDRESDLKARLHAVQNPAKKREETKGISGGLGGQYLSGQVSIGNSVRGFARNTRRFKKSADGLKDTIAKFDKALDGLDKVIAQKREALRAKKAASAQPLKKPKPRSPK